MPNVMSKLYNAILVYYTKRYYIEFSLPYWLYACIGPMCIIIFVLMIYLIQNDAIYIPFLEVVVDVRG